MNVKCLSDPHSSVILVQKVGHKVFYSYDLYTNAIFVISAKNECVKQGDVCPSALLCLNRNGSFACGCDPGFKVVGYEEARTCKGTIAILGISNLMFGLLPIPPHSSAPRQTTHPSNNCCDGREV